MLADAGDGSACVPATMLHGEGWLLRLVLDIAAELVASGEAPILPFALARDARWFSEALLDSAFLSQYRGDTLAESFTRADAVVGHFEFQPDARTGLRLTENATQFVVLEAKVAGHLSPGTRNAPGYHQAARTAACMAETLARAGRRPEWFDALAFHVVAPMGRIHANLYAKKMTAASIEERVRLRVEAYGGPRRTQLDEWLDEWLRPLLGVLDVRAISWESIIDAITQHDAALGRHLDSFYNRCLHYNGLVGAALPTRVPRPRPGTNLVDVRRDVR